MPPGHQILIFHLFWGVMLTSTFGRGPCTYLGFLCRAVCENPQQKPPTLWLWKGGTCKRWRQMASRLTLESWMVSCLPVTGWVFLVSVFIFFSKVYVYWMNRYVWIVSMSHVTFQVKRRINGVICSQGHPEDSACHKRPQDWWIPVPRKRDIRLVEQLLDVRGLTSTHTWRVESVPPHLLTAYLLRMSSTCNWYLTSSPTATWWQQQRRHSPRTSHLRCDDRKSTVIVIMIQPLVFTPRNDKGVLKV